MANKFTRRRAQLQIKAAAARRRAPKETPSPPPAEATSKAGPPRAGVEVTDEKTGKITLATRRRARRSGRGRVVPDA